MNFEAIAVTKRVPEIYVVGTMKGGTTILYDYIASHPMVLPGKQKEIHYFSMYPHMGIDWYLEQFPDRPEQVKTIDASPTYFDVATMPTIPAYIKQTAPSAKIILIVRHPVDRAISHFQHLRQVSHNSMFSHIEANEFFSRHLSRLFTREQPSDILFSHVLGFSMYDEKLSNFTQIWGRRNILVLSNEELRKDPTQCMRQVFEHCQLEWVDSEIFGTERYLSGSQNLSLSPEVYDHLCNLLCPSYERFCRQAGIKPANPVLRGGGENNFTTLDSLNRGREP